MADDIRAMTAELAGDPGSLVFLKLGEALRRRGWPEAALKVALAGTARHPALADAYDLLARVHSDLGDGEAAFDAWMDALQNDPSHLGAHKGLGFLYFRANDLARALRHLEIAREQDKSPGLEQGLARVREALAREEACAAEARPAAEIAGIPFSLDQTEPADAAERSALSAQRSAHGGEPSSRAAEHDLFQGFDGARDGLLLLDQNGLRLGGGIRNADNRDVSDAVAAHLAGVSREAVRTARLLDLGAWQSVVAECSTGNLHLSAPSDDTVLLTTRDASVPAGRLAVIAERAGAAARRWLERVS
jgi:tetratricopeptide (TPR) repeat protein